MFKYTYDGPVVVFGKCVVNHWKAETMAVSESKAKNNLRYQFNRYNNRVPASKVDLPGKIILVG